MIKQNFFLALILIFSLMACERNDKDKLDKKIFFPLDKPDMISKTEYELINQQFDDVLILSNILIWQQTNPNLWNDYKPLKIQIPDLDSSVYANFINNNNKGYYLDSSKVTEGKIKLLSDAEIDYLLNNSDFRYSWDEFYNWYPASLGLYSTSRAGFNQDSTLALICFGFNQPDYARHSVYYLKKELEKWLLIGSAGIETE